MKRRIAIPGAAMLGALLAGIPAPAMAAGGDLPPLVRDIGYSLLLAGVLAVIFVRFRIPGIAAFLGAGVLAGPLGLELVTDPGNIDTIAQLGFVLLLFVIGLEIDLRQVLGCGRPLLAGGLLQYPLTVLFGMAVAKLMLALGIGAGLLGETSFVPLYFGILIAASSTLLVVQLYAASFSLDTVAGRSSLSLLIFQDIWAVVVIALQPSLAEPALGPVVASLAGIALLAAVAALVSRFVTRPAFGWIAKTPELVLVAALAWCFVVVMLGVNLDRLVEQAAGFDPHLSVGAGMGALIAGMSLASSPFSTEIVSKVGVVRDFFVVLFFVGLGMSVPAPDSTDVLLVTAGLVGATVGSRLLLLFPLLAVTGLDRRNALVSSIRLAQMSEFALIVAFIGLQEGHFGADLASAAIFGFVLTALVTPPLFRGAHAIHDWLAGLAARMGLGAPPAVAESGESGAAIVMLGFHRFASSLLHELARSEPDLVDETLVVDFNLSLHDAIRDAGAKVLYGNLASMETLRHAGLGSARVVVLTIPDEMLVGTTNLRLVRAVRELGSRAAIVACATRLDEVDDLYGAGADYVHVPRLRAARELAAAIAFALNGQIADFRADEDARTPPPDDRDEVFR